MYKILCTMPRISCLAGHHSTPGVLYSMFSATSQNVELSVEPISCLHDEPVRIRVFGLSPGEDVTLQAFMEDYKGVGFISYAHYRANSCGMVDAATMESLGGHFKGIFPMGLIGSLLPAHTEQKFTRFFKKDPQNPNVVKVTAYKGHLGKEALCSTDVGEPLATITHLRHYVAPGVQRIPVHYKKVRGCLFLPPGDGPFPGVIDLFGSAGGLLEYRSAQLASRGFASLALAFFAYDDLPEYLEELNISYFEEAVEFLLKHDKVVKPHVGSIGVSKGGDLVLSLATFIPEVKAAVCINGSCANTQSSLHLHDRTIPGLDFDISKVKIDDDGVLDMYEAWEDPLDYPETLIPIEKADAHFLFLVGCEDRNGKSETYADQATERLRKAGRKNYEVHRYTHAGHLIEPPYSPSCYASYHKVIRMSVLWGGEPMFHQMAQVHAWNSTLAFLHKHLSFPKGKL
ncbi:acyl-coenzyme A thioesterase 1 isoform X2 [Cherax quadricarinatus]|uniref:acyl-coenzyme A thioesterase 1 isoform X2 n=1 Tax=Cherax quadricarinatus TaxID=27406 RepID=UPI00387EB05B